MKVYRWVIPVFFIVAFAIYGSAAARNGFLMDDFTQIVQNPNVHSLERIPHLFAISSINTAGSDAGIYYKPLMMLTDALLWQISPGSPALFHVFDVLLHAINAVLVFSLFYQFLQLEVALFGGLLFLCHPFNTETAIYLADLQDLLYMFFGLLSLTQLYGKEERRGGSSILFALFLLASVFSKETGLLFLFITLVYAWLFRRKSFARIAWLNAGVGGIYVYCRCYLAGLVHLPHEVAAIENANLATRLMTAPKVIGLYLYRFVAPWNFTTTQLWVVDHLSLNFWLPLTAVLLVLAGALVYGFRHRNKYFWLMFWWAVGGLGFHSQILAALDGTFAPRWFYFSFVGVTGVLLIPAEQFWNAVRRPWRITAAALILMTLGVLSSIRASEWENNSTLFRAEIERLPDSYVVQNNYGVDLFQKNDLQGALEHFQKSIELAPNWTVNWSNAGAVYERLGDAAKAKTNYERSIQNGAYALAYENYTALLIRGGQAEEARRFLDQTALKSFPLDEKLVQFRKLIQ